MTMQEYYDLLYASAYDGTFPSSAIRPQDEEIVCLYRLGKTAYCKQRCAAGLLIPDEKYSPDIEGRGAYANEVKCNIQLPEGMCEDDLSRVQSAHDNTCKQEGGWEAADFIRCINNLTCFANVNKREPKAEVTA